MVKKCWGLDWPSALRLWCKARLNVLLAALFGMRARMVFNAVWASVFIRTQSNAESEAHFKSFWLPSAWLCATNCVQDDTLHNCKKWGKLIFGNSYEVAIISWFFVIFGARHTMHNDHHRHNNSTSYRSSTVFEPRVSWTARQPIDRQHYQSTT